MAKLSGLYYPGESWDASLEDSVLKKCLIFFDKILAIVPEVFSVDWQDVQPTEEINLPLQKITRPIKLKAILAASESIKAGDIKLDPMQKEASLHEVDRYFRITKFMDKIEILRKEKVIEIVNPRENLLDPPYWENISEPNRPLYSAYPWMYIDSDYQSVIGKNVGLEKLEAYKPLILYGSILSDLKNIEFRNLTTGLGKNRVIVYKGQAEQNWIHQLGKASGFPEDEWQHFPSAAHYFGFPGTVSTAMWASLVVNHTLMTAHRYGLIPITPNSIFNELLQSKLRRLNAIRKVRQNEITYFDHPEYKGGFLGFSLAICSLPNLDLMSFEDVLELRTALGGELAAFRDEVFALAESIKMRSWDSEFRNEVDYTIKHKIEPIVRDLQRKLKSNRQEAVLRALKIGSAPTVLSVLASIWAGMPAILVMAVVAGLVSIETALGYYSQREKIYQSNGLSLLLRFQ